MKILIITYYWPPAGGPGVQRWLKFATYLPEFGVEPIVYIPKNPSYPILDQNLVKEVPLGITVIKKKITEPYSFASLFSKSETQTISSGIIAKSEKQSWSARFLLWVRGNFFIPDARVLWVKPSVKYLEKYIKENNIEAIVTTGPPHSLHLIGLELKKRLNIQWIADFRDPWTTIGYHKSLKLTSFSKNKHLTLEHKILNKADKIIVTSPTTKKEFYLKTNKPIAVITNGYDRQSLIASNLDEKFSLAHIGSFLSERNPIVLWQCLKEMMEEIPDFKTNFQLKLVGKVSAEVLKTIDSFGLTNSVVVLGYLSHQEALFHQKNSQVLLLIEINSPDTTCIIPGKLFEYLVSERPIIAIGPKNSDIEPIIKNTNTGVFFEYDQKVKLKNTLFTYYKAYLSNTLKVHAVGLHAYSRTKLTQQLTEFLKQ